MTTQNSAGISPNLLMNFNPYDILEPERNPQVDRLIDIGDVPSTAEVDASLLDQKKRYDLIDLYQNIYVTPQHVKKNDTANNEITASNSIDYNDFFNKIESGEKYDWTADNKKTKLSADGVELVRKPRVLIPKLNTTEEIKRNGFIEAPRKAKTFLDDDSDSDEDLIEEILAKKNIEKRILDELKNKTNTASTKQTKNDSEHTDFSRIKVLSTPQNTADFSRIKVLNTPTDSNFKEVTKTTDTTRNKTKPVEEDFDIAAELSRLKLNNTPKENTDTLKLQSPGIKLEGQINNTLNFTLIPIKKDEKAYRKKRVEKPKSQTCNFTKGADFYEKSVVLPQIMERIKERQNYLQERNNLNRRLILDGGARDATEIKRSKLDDVLNVKKNDPASPNNINKNTGAIKSSTYMKTTDNTWGKVNPISLMADCNKERLKAFEQGRMFQNFVKNGK